MVKSQDTVNCSLINTDIEINIFVLKLIESKIHVQ